MNRAFLYLSGDSYPDDDYIEHNLRERLNAAGMLFVGQTEFCGTDMGFQARKSALWSTSSNHPGNRVIAIGRSSGGRIASLAAAEGAPIAAVIVLGYPFRVPGEDEDPARTSHLATIATPTLILQGTADPYGTKAVAERRYPLSPFVRIVELDASHEFNVSAARWDQVVALILQHVESCRTPLGQLFR
ncbi:alpha/beta family hydrolase [Microbaculum marinum]|uniref:Alpha/beta family hydrolase n=1 Tax=Microbaculum marinum TaxID=1764581 RepID=A0AAW9RP64_9HYPH